MEQNKATNLYIRECKTKRFAGDDEVSTKLTLDCSDLTQRDFIEYALQSLVIKWQGNARRNATKQEGVIPIPKEATWKVPKPGVRTAMTIEQMVAALDDAGKQRLLASLLAQVKVDDANEAEGEE